MSVSNNEIVPIKKKFIRKTRAGEETHQVIILFCKITWEYVSFNSSKSFSQCDLQCSRL